jgi:hypothetical protein
MSASLVLSSVSIWNKMKPKSRALIYTILADDKPVAALEASGPEARELLSEQWFLHELSKLKVGGDPIYKAETRLRARPATEDEWAIYDHECNTADDADEVLFVYLVSTWIASGRHRLLGTSHETARP